MVLKVFLLFSIAITANAVDVQRSLYKRGLPDGAVAGKCPSDWKDPYCSCDVNYLSLTTTITCSDFGGIDKLKKSLNFTWKNRNYEWLVLQNLNLESFPKDTLNNLTFIGFIFQNVTLKNLDSKAFEEDGKRQANMEKYKIFKAEIMKLSDPEKNRTEISSSRIAEYVWASESNFTNFNYNALKPLRHLRSIAIMASHLKEIPSDAFEGLVHLEVLNMERNGITKIGTNAFSALPKLRRLELSSNNLTSLDDGILNTTGSLRDVIVILSENKISQVSSGAFDDLKTTNIHLERNKLTMLNVDAFSHLLQEMTNYGTGKLFVRDNPFDCTKSSEWITKKQEYVKQVIGFPCINKNELSNSGP